jgi:hypothetical protein
MCHAISRACLGHEPARRLLRARRDFRRPGALHDALDRRRGEEDEARVRVRRCRPLEQRAGLVEQKVKEICAAHGAVEVGRRERRRRGGALRVVPRAERQLAHRGM